MILSDQIKEFDKSDMLEVLKNFGNQCEEAVQIADSYDLSKYDFNGIDNIILNGLGGSAIGGDFVRSFLQYELPVPMFINRNYHLPAFASDKTLSIISSYSGNTEETNSAFEESLNKNCKIICITSGGKVEQVAKDNDLPCIKIPGGLQPRCALGYSFFVVLKIMLKLKLVEDKSKEISGTINHIKNLTKEYSDFENKGNRAIQIAKELKDKLPIIYSSVDVLDVVNLRWRGQIAENAKQLAFGNFYPEMNHNELVGWHMNKKLMKEMIVLMLEDKDDNSRIKARMEITSAVYKEFANGHMHISSNAGSILERIFELVCLGDWISYYLAIMNKVDPTPVKVIEHLKQKLAKI